MKNSFITAKKNDKEYQVVSIEKNLKEFFCKDESNKDGMIGFKAPAVLINRNTLTEFYLERLIADTKMNWENTSYGNDACDSLTLELNDKYKIQIWIPNSIERDSALDHEDFNKLAYRVLCDEEDVMDDYPSFTKYEDMLGSLRMLIAVYKSLTSLDVILAEIKKRPKDIQPTIERIVDLLQKSGEAKLSVCDSAPMFGWSLTEWLYKHHVIDFFKTHGYAVVTKYNHGVMDIFINKPL